MPRSCYVLVLVVCGSFVSHSPGKAQKPVQSTALPSAERQPGLSPPSNGALPMPPTMRIHAAQPGHAAVVTSIAFAPNESKLASASYDEALSLWDVTSGKEICRITGHPKLYSTCFSSDGRTLVSSGTDGTIRLWNPANGAGIQQLSGQGDHVPSIALSPDGKLVAAAEPQGRLALWEIATGKRTLCFKDPVSYSSTVLFSPDGDQVASSSFSCQYIALWDLALGRAIRQIGKSDTSMRCFTYSPDGKSLVSGGQAGLLVLWETATGGERLRFGGYPSTVHCLAVSVDGKTIFSGHEDGSIQAWDFVTGQSRGSFSGHRERVHCLAAAPRGGLLASGSVDMDILFFDLAGLNQQHRAPAVFNRSKPLAVLWDELASEDAHRAFSAILDMETLGDPCVTFLRQQSRAFQEVQGRIERALADLDHKRFVVRRTPPEFWKDLVIRRKLPYARS